ncbi:MAG: Sensor histidine kinase RcsC [Legionella sp.]|uniref:CHASE domain-containing protein n=1 Tax=Legionella sp. TaxID=459 RepID=UPI003D0F7000
MPPQRPLYNAYAFKLFFLAFLYFIMGKLGLYLAIPPGYATIIWPPSGIALGVLIAHGSNLWPGIFIGSFVLNSRLSGIYTPDVGFILPNIISASGIAIGSTIQALAGYSLIRHFVGLPLHMNRSSQITKVFLLGAPVACLIAATIGVFCLYTNGIITKELLVNSWLTWWSGDTLGVLVFFPLILILPLKENQTTWKGHVLNTLSSFGILTLLMSLSVTFYLWRIFSVEAYEQSLSKFQTLIAENKRSLLSNFTNYENTLLATAAFLKASPQISRSIWKNYAKTLVDAQHLIGIEGLGLILSVKKKELTPFVNQVRLDGDKKFKLYPQSYSGSNYFIITYIEPQKENINALGLNIAFEKRRLNAALLSRETGKTTISDSLQLVQDDQKTAGFLILHPIHLSSSSQYGTHSGWVYLAILARNFISQLTENQNRYLNVKIYEGNKPHQTNLIYQSDKNIQVYPSVFKQSSVINVMQKQWLIVWESTPLFEATEKSYFPLIILVCGFLFSAVFALFLFINAMKKTSTQEWLASREGYLFPAFIFIILSFGATKLYLILENNQSYYLEQLLISELNTIDLLVKAQLQSGINALERMARRWEQAEGTPYKIWSMDATNYIDTLKGLHTVEWIDPTYRIRWVKPLEDNKNLIGMNISSADIALKNVTTTNNLANVRSFTLTQGRNAFTVYFPLTINQQFGGLLAGIFSISEFFNQSIPQSLLHNYHITLSQGAQVYFQNKINTPIESDFAFSKEISFGKNTWTLQLIPTKQFIKYQKNQLPLMILISNLIIALLLAVFFRSIMISHLKSLYLEDSHKKLKESEERYNLVVDGMSVGLWDWKINEDKMYWSDKLKKMFGIKNKLQIPNMDYFMSNLHPDDKDETAKMLNDHLHHNGPYDIEYRFKDEEGNFGWFHACGQATWDQFGNAIRMAGSVADINERVNAKIALQESNKLKNAILTGAKHIIIATDASGVVTVFNHAAENELGYSAHEIIGKETPAIWHDPKEIIQKATDLSDELGYTIAPHFDVFVEKAKRFGSDEGEWTFIRKNGSRFPVRLTATPLKNQEQVITGYLGVIENITERKQIENIKNEFVSMISHELRTPITSIRASLGFILDDMAEELSPIIHNLLNIANDNCERLILLINDMLDMNKIACGQMRFAIQKENLAELLKQTKNLNQAYADKYDVIICAEPVDSEIYINVDADRFEQVMTNILSNAIKFSPPKSSVVIKSSCIENSVCIRVEDNGIGISKEFHNRIFTPFSQDDSSHKNTKEGTGLGLHICKQMVEKMNGSIGFESEIGKGSCFWIQFEFTRFKEEYSC